MSGGNSLITHLTADNLKLWLWLWVAHGFYVLIISILLRALCARRTAKQLAISNEKDTGRYMGSMSNVHEKLGVHNRSAVGAPAAHND